MLYKENWQQTMVRWESYWKRDNTGCPLMYVLAVKPDAVPMPDSLCPIDMADKYYNVPRMVERFRHYCDNHLFLADSFPNMSADFGPGSVAGYLGSEIVFNPDTVWFDSCVQDWSDYPELLFDQNNKWWQLHYQLVKDIRALAGEDFYIGIPDLMENIDVLASLRGMQDVLFDMIDEPEIVHQRILEVSNVYFEYYNRFYDIVKNQQDGGSCYTVFQIWGKGRTAKLQCDFSALMSPDNFREFIQQPLREQAKQLDNVLYHLDGPDAIRHVDALMEIDEIDSLQWTSGDHGPDGTLEDWDVIYDKVRRAGKSLWIKVYSGEYGDWVAGADRIVKKYGSKGLFLMFPEMSKQQADSLLTYAEKNWSNVEGSFK